MKTAKIIFLFFILIGIPSPVLAKKNTYVLGGGAVFGQDVSVIKGFGGGIAAKGGFYFTDQVALLGKLEFFYARDRGLNYFGLPLTALAHIDIAKGFYGEIGGGYDLIIPEQGIHFRDGGTSKAQPYIGPRGEINFGRAFRIGKQISFVPELGMSYAHVGGINRLLPQARLMIQSLF